MKYLLRSLNERGGWAGIFGLWFGGIENLLTIEHFHHLTSINSGHILSL